MPKKPAAKERQPLPKKHTDKCPASARVWKGTKWVCTNHYPHIPLNVIREPFVPQRRLKLAEMLATDEREELGELRDNVRVLHKEAKVTESVLDAANDAAEDLPGIIEERDQLRARVDELEAGALPAGLAKLQAEGAELIRKLATVEAERDHLAAELLAARSAVPAPDETPKG